jgi:ABC-type multidrug transport system fused ATPase/permease subunit
MDGKPMYELLLRIETLLLGLQTPALWAIGIGAIGVGLVLWLGGTRYHAAIIGVLGAVVGSAAGLLVSQQFNLIPWLSVAIGAAVLAGLSILFRNVLILVLAVLVFSAVSGAGYVSVVLDRAVPQAQSQSQSQIRTQIQAVPTRAFQFFSGMDLDTRQKYMNDISQHAQTFSERLKALLANTWQALGPRGWIVVLPIVAGAVVGVLLVWLIAKIVIALAYSIVGTATLLLGAHAALLAAGVPVVADLESRRWLPLAVFVAMTAVGWVWQVFFASARIPKKKPPQEAAAAD